MRVPTDLLPLYGKQEFIRKSLGTSDYREAKHAVRFEAFKQDAEFEEKRREIKSRSQAERSRPRVTEIGDRQAHEMAVRWFIRMQKETVEWWDESGHSLRAEELQEAVENFGVEATAFNGGNDFYEADDGSRYLDGFLKVEGLDVPKASSAYRKLRSLCRMALLENAQEKIALLRRTGREAHPLFRDVSAFTALPQQLKIVTLAEMLTRFSTWLADAGRTRGTRSTYEIPARLLREILGENTPVAAITKDDIERLFGLLRRAPANATKRYRGLTLERAIAAADKRNDAHRLGGKTLENYFNNVVAIFNFAVEKGMMSANPAKDRYLRATFERAGDDKPKALFSIDELNRLFRAPLYVGCRDDGNGYAKPGSNRPRRGRFWLPLLALFHGLRLNEAAQLYTEDVGETEGIPYFEIREERADGSKCDKRLKTSQSKRQVPIHPEIIRMGFPAYVADRRADTSHPRLFPDLPLGVAGYFSNPFSKWFGRFLTQTLGDNCEATFHSFRHAFRDGLREAGISIDDAEALGGWEIRARSAERNYGKGPSVRRLREQIEKVSFPGLDLEHLRLT